MVKAIKLYVGNLPDGTKPGELQAAFEKYGQVEECDVLRNYGFIHISNEDEAKVAMESLNNSEFNGSRITVEISHNKGQCYRCGRQGHIPKECPLNAKTYTRTNSSIPKESWWCNAEVQEAVDEKKSARKKWEETQTDEDRKIYVEKKKEAKRRVAQAKARAYRTINDSKRRDGKKSFYNKAPQRKQAPKDNEATKLYVGNLSESVTSADIRTLFEKHGKVEECDVLKNYGFVHMTNEDEAKDAVESLHQSEFMDTKINVEISKSKGQCYSCGQHGHWSKECMSNMGGRSGLGSASLMSRFGRQFDRGFGMDRAYRTERMRPYPDMYDRRPLAQTRASSDDYYRGYSDYYGGFSRSTPSYMNSGSTFDRGYDYGQYRRSQDPNSSSSYNYMWSSSNPNTA